MWGIVRVSFLTQTIFCSFGIAFNLLFCLIIYRSKKQDLGFYRCLLVYYAVFEIIYATLVLFTLPIHVVSEYTWIFFSFKGPLMGTNLAFLSSAVYCLFYEMWLGLVMVNFIYRYIAVCKPEWIHKIRQSIFLKVFLLTLFLSYNAMCVLCTIYFCAVNKITDDIEGNISFGGMSATFIHFIIVVGSFFVIIFCSYNIIREIRQMQRLQTSVRISLERQLFGALLIQSVIPMFLCQIPSIVNLSYPLWDNVWFAPAEPFFAALTTIPKALDPIITIVCITEYRNCLLKMIGLRKPKTYPTTTISAPTRNVVLADYEKVAQALIRNNTNGTQPTMEWLSKVADRAHEYAKQQVKPEGNETVDLVDIKTIMEKFRNYLGPRSNKTRSAKAEVSNDLDDVAFQGDMILNPDQWDELLKENTTIRKRAVTTNPNLLWTIGVPIPYTLDSSLGSTVSKIRAGIQFWSDNSCLKFVESETLSPRLNFINGSGCWSYVGKQSAFDSQDVSIGTGCESHGTICHEIAHAMGFFHTQSRYDRDDYLDVYYSNIIPSQVYNFAKQTPETETHFGLPFDYGSVMLYDPYAFALNPYYPTLAAIDLNYQNAMGQREAPAFSDVMEMNLLYKCADLCPTKPSCKNNGIVNPNTCQDCLCPRYFTGSFCDYLNPGTAPVCNGEVVQARSPSFTQLNATVGLGTTFVYDDVDIPSDCFWMIQAPTGRALELQVTFLDSECMESCPWGAFEINLGYTNQYGIITCCSSIYTQTFKTVHNIALIRGYSRYNNINMSINYRVV